MTTATKANRRQQARDLSEAEIVSLGQIGASSMPSLPGDGSDLELTEAEALLLEAKGATVVVANEGGTFEEENPLATEAGSRLFKIGEGDSQFTGTLTHSNSDREKVFLWHPTTGVKRALVRAHLFYYVAKGWLPRPPEGIEPPKLTVKCLSMDRRCKRLFANAYDAREHFEKAHVSEAKQARKEREAARQERLDAILERLVENGAAGAAAGDNSAVIATLLAELTASVKDLQTGNVPITGVPAADAAEIAEGTAPGDAA